MFIRYKTDGRGKSEPVAKIYTSKEHPIRNSMIDKDALWAIRKLQASGAEAYIVGGSVRDLMLGRKPKDFDIATSASPRQVQRLFWNSRIIGKRFRIVHLFFSSDKIIEVTTFRSDEENFEEGNNNVYGTIEQDAKRRDFSINALYYNPQNCQILDFNNAIEDLKKHIIRSLIPLNYAFSEDPVRMIRALKYQATTGFKLKWNVSRAIKKNAGEIINCSTSRLTEEVYKILSSGCAEAIFKNLKRYQILAYLLPCYALYSDIPEVSTSLNQLDSLVKSSSDKGEKVPREVMLYYLIKPAILTDNADGMNPDELFKDIFRQAKILLSPTTPPNYELEKASSMILKDLGVVRRNKKKRQNVKKNTTNVKKVSAVENEKMRRRKKSQPKPKTVVVEEQGAKTLAESHDL